VVVAAVLWVLGARHALALVTWGTSAFVLTIIAIEFWKGTRARARIEGEGYATALFHLVTRNRRRWGGYIVHVGIVMIFMAFAGAAYNSDTKYHMMPGDMVEVTSPMGHSYQLTYEGLSVSIGRGQRNLAWQMLATVSVAEDGEPVGVLTPEKRMYVTAQQPMTEVGIRSTPFEDLYLILAAVDDMQGALNTASNDPAAQGINLQVLVKPLVSWIWLGCLILALGTIIALWPSVERSRARPRAVSEEPAREPAGEAAGAAAGD
jgi:cytochrome c-type biogenesis protein CcmF